jgi:transposase
MIHREVDQRTNAKRFPMHLANDLPGEKPSQGMTAECHDHLRLDDRDLPSEVRPARLKFIGKGVPIPGGRCLITFAM